MWNIIISGSRVSVSGGETGLINGIGPWESFVCYKSLVLHFLGGGRYGETISWTVTRTGTGPAHQYWWIAAQRGKKGDEWDLTTDCENWKVICVWGITHFIQLVFRLSFRFSEMAPSIAQKADTVREQRQLTSRYLTASQGHRIAKGIVKFLSDQLLEMMLLGGPRLFCLSTVVHFLGWTRRVVKSNTQTCLRSHSLLLSIPPIIQ